MEKVEVDSEALTKLRNMLDEASAVDETQAQQEREQLGTEAAERVDQYMQLQQGILKEEQDDFIRESKDYLGLDQEQALDLQAYVNTKWGFLKNIININTFFQGENAANEAGKAFDKPKGKASSDSSAKTDEPAHDAEEGDTGPAGPFEKDSSEMSQLPHEIRDIVDGIKEEATTNGHPVDGTPGDGTDSVSKYKGYKYDQAPVGLAETSKKLKVAAKAVKILQKKLNAKDSELKNTKSPEQQSLIQNEIDKISSKKKMIEDRIQQLQALNQTSSETEHMGDQAAPNIANSSNLQQTS